MDNVNLPQAGPITTAWRQSEGIQLSLNAGTHLRRWCTGQLRDEAGQNANQTSAQTVREVCGLLSMDKRVSSARDSLLLAINAHMNDTARRHEFEQNLYHFEARAQSEGNTADQVRKTYQDLYLILNDDQTAVVSKRLKAKFVEQWVQNLADPVQMVTRPKAKEIGLPRPADEDGCDYAILQIAEIKRNPAAMTRAIAQALTDLRIEIAEPNAPGKKTFLTIGRMSLQPDLEASELSGLVGARKYADQIAQVLIKNMNRRSRPINALDWSPEVRQVTYN